MMFPCTEDGRPAINESDHHKEDISLSPDEKKKEDKPPGN